MPKNYPTSGVLLMLKNGGEVKRSCSKFLPFMAVNLTKLQHPFSATYLSHHKITPSPLHKDIKGGSRGIQPLILNSVLDRGQSSASCPGRYTPGKGNLVPAEQETLLTPDLVWLFLRREKYLALARTRSLDHPARSPVIISTTRCGASSLFCCMVKGVP